MSIVKRTVAEWHTRQGGCYVNTTYGNGRKWASISLADWKGDGVYIVSLLGHDVQVSGSQHII